MIKSLPFWMAAQCDFLGIMGVIMKFKYFLSAKTHFTLTLWDHAAKFQTVEFFKNIRYGSGDISNDVIWGLERAAGAKKSLFWSVSTLKTPQKCDFSGACGGPKKSSNYIIWAPPPSATHVRGVGWLVTQESGRGLRGGIFYRDWTDHGVNAERS